ncbi:MAG: trypsin-like serine protease [Flavobacteriales bacterium]|nr:trypsin-like serine protease [Flavobacteriales bacterium]
MKLHGSYRFISLPEKGILMLILAILLSFGSAWSQTHKDQDPDEIIQIVGGENSSAEELPWQVYIGGCGATVLSDMWVMTAAHCQPSTGQTLTFGMTRRSQGGTQTRKASQVIYYPGNSGGSTSKPDFCLIKLDQALDLSDPKVQAIPWVTASDATNGMTDPGVMALTSGWGTLSSGGSSPDVLQKVEVPIVKSSDAGYGNQITEWMIAAGYMGTGGKDACQGDSGGPFIVRNGSCGWKLAGVVSWGDGCAEANYAGVYSRISYADDWIRQTTGLDPNAAAGSGCISLSSDNQLLCAGQSATFTATSDGAVSFSWKFTGGQPSTSTSQNPVITYNTAGTYPVYVKATMSNGDTTSINQVDYITVMPSTPDPVVPDVSRCGAGVVNMTATGTGTMNWYDAAVAGNLVHTGNTYSPNLSNTTTYYVEALDEKAAVKGGPSDNTFGSGGNFTSNADRRLYFDVLKPVVLKSVKVYATGAGNRTIVVLNSSGDKVGEVTANIPDGESRVTLDITLQTGSQFAIKTDDIPNLYRNNSGANYPYNISNLVSITETDAGSAGYYYYFYDWEVTEAVCESQRVAVTATITSGSLNTSTSNAPDNGTCNGTATVTATGGSGTYTYLWNDPASQTAATATGLCTGNYTVTVSDAGGCTATETVTVPLNTSLGENSASVLTGIYPNPTTDHITVNVHVNHATGLQLSVVNTLGETIIVYTASGIPGDNSFPVDMSALQSGIYFLMIQDEQTTHTARIVKY